MSKAAQSPLSAELNSAAMIVDAILNGSMTAETAMESCISVIKRLDPKFRAFVDLHPEEALAAAKIADTVPKEHRGLLHGLPIAIKEVFDVKGMHCSWGSEIHRHRVPEHDAVAVKRLKDAGAIIVGTTVSTEYAIAAAGPTVNPHDSSCTPGGSSSGSAAAVASGMVTLALGSQTVGSIVRPATYCGVYGLKPTRGAIPGCGGMPLSPFLDHPGIIGRTAEDLVLACKALFGPYQAGSERKGIAPPGRLPDKNDLIVLAAKQIPPEPVSKSSQSAVDFAAERLRDAGVRVESFIFQDHYNSVVDVLYTIMTRDMALAHGRDRDRVGELMSPQLRELIDRGRRVTETQYETAIDTAQNWRAEIDNFLGDNAVIISPATDDVAPPLSQGTGSNRPQAIWSLLGLPVAAIPCTKQGGMPLGIQAAAGIGREDVILAIAKAMRVENI